MMWYGMFATTSYGGGQRLTRSWSSASPSITRRRPSASSPVERLAQLGDQPAVELHGGDRGAGREQPAGEEAQAGPDLEHAPPGSGSASCEDPLEHVDIGEEVLRQVVARPEPGLLEAPPDEAGRGGGPRGASRLSAARALIRGSLATAARWASRRARGPRGRPRRAPRPGRADHRAVVRAQPRPGHDDPETACRRARGDPCPEGLVRGDAAAQHDPRAPVSSAARIVLVARTSTTASWKPQASSARRSSGSGAAAASGGRPASARASAMIRRAAVLRPEKLKSYESPIHARGKTPVARGRALGRGADRGSARIARGRAAGRPCRTPRPRHRRRSCRGAGT